MSRLFVEFIFIFHSNYVSILYYFLNMAGYSKIATFPTHIYLACALTVYHCNFTTNFAAKKSSAIVWRSLPMTRSTVLIERLLRHTLASPCYMASGHVPPRLPTTYFQFTLEPHKV